MHALCWRKQIQTKFTSPAGQDPSDMPYNADDPLETQIRTSVASSLRNLRPSDEDGEGEASYLDALLLHSPLPTVEETMQAWRILESYVPGKIRRLGISNVSLEVLQAVHQAAHVKPQVVQNRFYPQTRYDVQLRAFCREQGIEYQSFWTLTGNPHLVQTKPVLRLAQGAGVSAAVALYALVVDLGIVVLNGTTSSEHMREDLEGVGKVREWAKGNGGEWEQARVAIRKLVGETESTVKELEDMWD